ncbi:MAG: hypothetical protein PVJ38_04850 [Candidatus Bathyarchaeota archaeon]
MEELILELRQIESQVPERVKTDLCDSMLDSFIIDSRSHVEVNIEGAEAEDIKHQLTRKIKERYLEDIVEAEVVSNKLYLRK